MTSGGGAIVIDAHLYTVSPEGLTPYGKGRLFWERGEYVQLGMPRVLEVRHG